MMFAASQLIFLGQSFTLHSGAMGLSGIILLSLFLFCVPSDVREFRIPNRFTYPAIVAGLALNSWYSLMHWFGHFSSDEWLGGIGMRDSVFGLALCFSGMTLFFITLGCGAGDVKLMAAIGALLGWRSGVEVWLCAMVLAAAYVLVLVVPGRLLFSRHRGSSAESLGDSAAESDGRVARASRSRSLPMAPFFAAGTLCVVLMPVILPEQSLLEFLGLLS